jgi:hypothetical protein
MIMISIILLHNSKTENIKQTNNIVVTSIKIILIVIILNNYNY